MWGSWLFPTSGPTTSLPNLALPSQIYMGNEREERANSQEIGYGGGALGGKTATAPFGMWGQVAAILQHWV